VFSVNHAFSSHGIERRLHRNGPEASLFIPAHAGFTGCISSCVRKIKFPEGKTWPAPKVQPTGPTLPKTILFQKKTAKFAFNEQEKNNFVFMNILSKKSGDNCLLRQ
jgi:hypothetical protein